MKKLILLTLTMMLALPFVFSTTGNVKFGTNYSADASDYIAYDRFNRSDGDAGTLSTEQDWTNAVIKDQKLFMDSPNYRYFYQDLSSSYADVFTVDIIYNIDVNKEYSFILYFDNSGGTNRHFFGLPYDGFKDTPFEYDYSDSGGEIEDFDVGIIPLHLSDTTFLLRAVIDTGSFINGTLYNFSVDVNSIVTLKELSKLPSRSATNLGDIGKVSLRFNDVSDGDTLNITEIAIYNGTERPAGSSSNTAPPVIESYNLSAPAGDCTSWPSGICSTPDSTPTVLITTDKSATCAIGLENWNYTKYSEGINRTCENIDTKTHICTIRDEDQIVYKYDSIYISCIDTYGYENATSTSGPLSIEILGREEETGDAIEKGIDNALFGESYTKYPNQKVYARSLSGVQKYGIFDWVVRMGNKAWAFNYITAGEEHVGMFNISPVLYVLEMSNITNSTITSSVEALIDETK
jgi:hypothetical protein